MLTNTERQQIVEEVNAGTYGIDEALDDIAAAQKGEEVRKALYAEALVLNREGHAGSTDMIARQQIANLQTSVNGQISTLRTEVGDDIDDLETALNSGLATQNGKIAAQNASIANVVKNYNLEYGSETLWEATGETGLLASGTTATLSKDVSNFDYVDIYSFCGNSNVLDTVPVDAKLQSSQGYALRWVNLSDPDSGSYKAYVRIVETRLHIIGTTLTIDHQVTYRNGEEVNISGAEITQSNRSTYMGELGIMKVVGRKITANTEIEDVRIGADGTEYASAGQAVRAQVNDLESAIPAIDTTLSAAGAAADAKKTGDEISQIKADLEDYNSYNIFDFYGMYNGGTSQGATLTWDNTTHVGTITRVAAASGDTVFGAILGSNSGIPAPLVRGETYILQSDISNDNVKLQMVEYRGSAMTLIYVNGLIKYTIPNDIDGIMWRLHVKKEFVGTATIRVKMLNAPTNKMIGDNTVSAPSGAKLLSFGNSILTGIVWKNGAFDHLASYDNSPYGNIASALNISEKNVVHTMISSTGLMYDAGEGSFLDNILNTDITGYDYILTHLFYQDLTSAVSSGIGSLDSTVDDGTIAGAILSLLAYIRTNNPNCRLILVGVPPTGQNNSDIAENVFTVGYSNGSNIMECDYLMHQLAEQEHFVFVDWEDLELSYHWKDFTDNNNIHLNNEATYRVIGEYLGNQITAQKNEGDSNRVVTRCCKIKWTPNTYINRFGLESASDNHKVSDFIPVVPGETIRMRNVVLTTAGLIYLTCYDITKSKIADARKESGTAGSIVSEVEEYIVPSTGAYIRVTTALTQVYCHVWHKDKTYIPHPQIESVKSMIIGDNNACAIEIGHYYIEGKIVDPNNAAIDAENWANTGIVPLYDTYDYIKLLNVSAGQSCFALFLDSNQKVISADLADSSGVLAAERIIKPPVGATYIRCNMLKANKDIFKIYGLKTNLVVGNAVPETANQTFHAMTGNKLHTIFRKTKAIGPLFTITDDDTTSLSNVQKFHTVCMAEGIRGCYAVMTKNTEADSNIVDALREYEKDGFQCVVHCHHQRPIYKTSPDRNIVACREDMAIALQNMQKYGFSDFRHWISPYGVRDQEMKDFARDFGFDCLITVPTDTYCHYIPHPMYDQFAMPRMELYPTDDVALNGNTLAKIKAQMLDCATNGGWFHLCTHMYQWGDDLSRVTEILQYANTLGMKNVTISGGLSYWRDIYRMYDLF